MIKCGKCGSMYAETSDVCPCCGNKTEEGEMENNPKDDEQVVTEQEETMSEVIERAMEANVKRLLANEITQDKHIDSIANMALLNAVTLQMQLGNGYATHTYDQNKQKVENNRKTLDFLYGVDPVEGAGLSLIISAVKETLKQESK